VICGPGSKALLFGLMTAIGGPGAGVAVTRPSWVSYAAQAALSGRTVHFVPGPGGVPDANQLARAVTAARAAGTPVRSVVVTLPDNPTGLLAPAAVPAPQAAFYLYPDFSPLADVLLGRHGITSDEGLAGVLLREYGVGVLPGSAFGEDGGRLRLRVATSMIYGDTDAERRTALNSADPCSLPWIAASLARLEEVLADLTG